MSSFAKGWANYPYGGPGATGDRSELKPKDAKREQRETIVVSSDEEEDVGGMRKKAKGEGGSRKKGKGESGR